MNASIQVGLVLQAPSPSPWRSPQNPLEPDDSLYFEIYARWSQAVGGPFRSVKYTWTLYQVSSLDFRKVFQSLTFRQDNDWGARPKVKTAWNHRFTDFDGIPMPFSSYQDPDMASDWQAWLSGLLLP